MQSTDQSRLASLGWDDWFAARFASVAAGGAVPARVVADHGSGHRSVHTGTEVLVAALHHRVASAARRGAELDLPAIGDWVAIRRSAGQTVIETVVERRTAFRRKVAGHTSHEQVMAANIDVAMVVAALDAAPNLRRLERALAAALASGARPLVLLNKADLAGDTAVALTAETERIAGDAPVVAISAITGQGVERLTPLIPPGTTAVLLGPSGVGKSTLVNRLSGNDVMRTGAVRADGKGRHTTTHRELFPMPWGGLLIDTPGLRELQLWADVDEADGLAILFADIDELAARCRFADCEHAHEPGCAVQAAIARGDLTAGRLQSYRKLRREAGAVERRVGTRHRQAAALGRRRRIAQMREEELGGWGS
ncbi:MAG TPA: ribosome small subunit-dependent GTPase A [Candidatus Dormibacteraeota bacterium]|nr:ribosome small subunit-dependent GTPase A [Candidatus Dormibacteraeota bacterium]